MTSLVTMLQPRNSVQYTSSVFKSLNHHTLLSVVFNTTVPIGKHPVVRAAGQCSAKRGSDKVSLLHIVLQKISLKDVSSCEITNVCKSGYTVHPVTFGPNPSPTHRSFSYFISWTLYTLSSKRFSQLLFTYKKC